MGKRKTLQLPEEKDLDVLIKEINKDMSKTREKQSNINAKKIVLHQKTKTSMYKDKNAEIQKLENEKRKFDENILDDLIEASSKIKERREKSELECQEIIKEQMAKIIKIRERVKTSKKNGYFTLEKEQIAENNIKKAYAKINSVLAEQKGKRVKFDEYESKVNAWAIELGYEDELIKRLKESGETPEKTENNEPAETGPIVVVTKPKLVQNPTSISKATAVPKATSMLNAPPKLKIVNTSKPVSGLTSEPKSKIPEMTITTNRWKTTNRVFCPNRNSGKKFSDFNKPTRKTNSENSYESRWDLLEEYEAEGLLTASDSELIREHGDVYILRQMNKDAYYRCLECWWPEETINQPDKWLIEREDDNSDLMNKLSTDYIKFEEWQKAMFQSYVALIKGDFQKSNNMKITYDLRKKSRRDVKDLKSKGYKQLNMTGRKSLKETAFRSRGYAQIYAGLITILEFKIRDRIEKSKQKKLKPENSTKSSKAKDFRKSQIPPKNSTPVKITPVKTTSVNEKTGGR